MNEKMMRVVAKYEEKLNETVTAFVEKSPSKECFDQVKDKVICVIAEQIDSTMMQLKENPSSCHQKDIKKAMNILDKVFESEAFKSIRVRELKSMLSTESKNKSKQELLSHFCIIAQNQDTKEYAKIVYEPEDDMPAGYVIDFTSKRSEATEISKIAESDLAVEYIQKLLNIDFPEINWKVFKSARMIGRETTSYPIY